MPALFPVLITERLILRQPSASDAQQMLMLRSNPVVNKYLGRKPTETVAEAAAFIEKVNGNFIAEEGLYWAITLNDNQELIGTICLFDFSAELSKCEIGYELLPAYQGQGFMGEALKKVIHFAFQTLGIKSIEAFTHKDNQGSNKLLHRLGFKDVTNEENTPPDFKTFRLTGEV